MGKRRAPVPALSLPGVEGGGGAGGGGGGGGVHHLPAPAREVVIFAENALEGADILHGMLQDVHLEKEQKSALWNELPHCTENRIYLFPEKNCAAPVPIPTLMYQYDNLCKPEILYHWKESRTLKLLITVYFFQVAQESSNFVFFCLSSQTVIPPNFILFFSYSTNSNFGHKIEV